MQNFNLKTAPGVEICPSTGEDLGRALIAAAEARLEAMVRTDHALRLTAQFFYLAADAYDRGAGVTIGHTRTAMYEEAAERARTKAAGLEAEAKRLHDDAESERLLACFHDGFAGRDISRHSFERREAAQLGEYFAIHELGIPGRINKRYTPRPLGRDSEPDYLEVDGAKWRVSYPDGKVTSPVIERVAA